jgi:chorismate synthase
MMGMDWTKLEEKYWRGESTLEEESALREAAKSTEAALSATLRRALLSLDAVNEPSLGDDFDAQFWRKTEEQEEMTQNGPLTLSIMMRYAAAAVVLVAMGFTIAHLLSIQDPLIEMNQTAVVEDSFDDPEQALHAATQALGLASEKLNEVQQPLKEIKRFHQSKTAVVAFGAKTIKQENNK